MTFLNPAILFGLLAASIPVLIHLLNLRRLKRIEFSTLKFLKELQKNKIRKIKVKQWLLLALRVLIVLLLVTAFARPTLKGLSIGGTTSAAKTSAVFILDDTFSMSVVNQQGSYFNQAKQKIKQLLGDFEEGDEAAIILISAQQDKPEFTSNITALTEEINQLTISYVTNSLHSAMLKTAELIASSNNFNKEVFLLTDFQKGRIKGKVELPDLSELLNDQVRLYSFNYKPVNVYNIGIDDLTINTQIFEKDKPIEFETVVTNYSKTSADNLVVSLFTNGERTAQQSIDLKSGETKNVLMESSVGSTGIVDVFAELEDDDVLQDNKRYTALTIPEKIAVLLLTEDKNDSKFVKLALNSAASKDVFVLTEKKINELNIINLNNFDALILIGDDINVQNKKVQKFMEDGKGIIIFPPSKSVTAKFNSLLSSLKLPSDAGLTSAKDITEAAEFEKVEFEHPLFENIFLSDEKKEIESPKIFKHFNLKSGARGKTIISLIDGSSFIGEFNLKEGTVFIFNTAPVLSWSDFPLKSIFAPLINKMIFYIASKDGNNTTILAGERIVVNISNRTLPRIKIEKPDNQEEIINLKDQYDSDFLYYSKTGITGNYKFYSGTELLNVVSVNANPVESNIDYITQDEFEDYLKKIKFKGMHFSIDINEDPSAVVLKARFGSELWRYFLIAAFVLALIEMMISRNVKKETVELESK